MTHSGDNKVEFVNDRKLGSDPYLYGILLFTTCNKTRAGFVSANLFSFKGAGQDGIHGDLLSCHDYWNRWSRNYRYVSVLTKFTRSQQEWANLEDCISNLLQR
ncbi:unnamed protein product [Lactuca virosa]|uniref:Uncharacterized protein n=1 Tax=Lactuca virosa TaxID=75947 RepID=A0AAU9MVK3_9ASTR|nr:unnamed protein product [Lactuca virosa]